MPTLSTLSLSTYLPSLTPQLFPLTLPLSLLFPVLTHSFTLSLSPQLFLSPLSLFPRGCSIRQICLVANLRKANLWMVYLDTSLICSRRSRVYRVPYFFFLSAKKIFTNLTIYCLSVKYCIFNTYITYL